MALNLGPINNLSKLWEDICNLVIRPHRCTYEPSVALGPRLFTLGNKIYERRDLQVKNGRGLKLQCSHYQPIESQRPTKKMPCVIYCHGNCGSRCDALDAVQILLPYNITVLAFDFSGSGLSGGDYVSLGYFEQQDIAAIVVYLRGSNTVSRIGLWGRSMGAATSIMYSANDPQIAGIVADSPFTSLEDVMTELVLSHKSWVPRKVIKVGINMMRYSIQNRANFDIRMNSPIEYAKKCYVPILFAHAEGDDFIKVHHSEKLFETYCGDKNIIRFEGDHNSERPDYFYDAVCIFFYNTLISNDPNLEDKHVPMGSISSKTGVGLSTGKGRSIAEEDDDDDDEDGNNEGVDDFIPKTPPDTTIHLATSSSLDLSSNLQVPGILPSTPKSQQIYLPNSLLSEQSKMKQSEDEQFLIACIESVKSELEKCDDEAKKKTLQQRLDELMVQVNDMNIKNTDIVHCLMLLQGHTRNIVQQWSQ